MIDVADGNAVYYYHFDGVGSVVALSDVNSVIVERYSYDIFGEPNRTSDVNNPYLFTGRRYDSETGLYYYRARYYSPQLGRFLQPDPVTMYLQLDSTQPPKSGKIPGTYLLPKEVKRFLKYDPIGRYLAVHPTGRFLQASLFGHPVELNLYTYCGNNPITWIDPYGLGIGGWIGAAIGGAIGAGLGFVIAGGTGFVGTVTIGGLAGFCGAIGYDIGDTIENAITGEEGKGKDGPQPPVPTPSPTPSPTPNKKE